VSFEVSKIEDQFEPSRMVSFFGDSEEALKFIQQKQYSTLERIGYTQQMVDIFAGRLKLKTTWSPHPHKGTPVEGNHKEWSPVEWWVFQEWKKGIKGIVLSPNQMEWVSKWHILDILEFIITGGRDSGKSWIGAIGTLYSMVFFNDYYKNYLVSLFAGAKSQTGTVYEEHIIPMIARSNHIHNLVSEYDPMWDYIAKRKKAGVKEIELKMMNGARLVINPTSTKAARSKHPDMLWLDEAVEAEDISRGNVISSALSSLTAGHHMRVLATSTVHKHPNGWFAQRVRRARRLQEQGKQGVVFCNLSKGGLGTKTWITLEDHKKELAFKAADGTINLNAEFYGEIVGGDGNAFYQEHLAKCVKNSKKPVFDPHLTHIMGHDPGFGTSYYGLVIIQTDGWKIEVIHSDFWYRKSPTSIIDEIEDLVDTYNVSFHACDIYGTSTIKSLQERGFEVKGYAFNHKPDGWDDMLPDEQERFKAPQKYIGIGYINELLAQNRFRLYPAAGAYKAYDQGLDSEPLYANQILLEQMQSYQIDPNTNKFIKGSDDMIDALNFGCLPVVLGHMASGKVVDAGNL